MLLTGVTEQKDKHSEYGIEQFYPCIIHDLEDFCIDLVGLPPFIMLIVVGGPSLLSTLQEVQC